MVFSSESCRYHQQAPSSWVWRGSPSIASVWKSSSSEPGSAWGPQAALCPQHFLMALLSPPHPSSCPRWLTLLASLPTPPFPLCLHYHRAFPDTRFSHGWFAFLLIVLVLGSCTPPGWNVGNCTGGSQHCLEQRSAPTPNFEVEKQNETNRRKQNKPWTIPWE